LLQDLISKPFFLCFIQKKIRGGRVNHSFIVLLFEWKFNIEYNLNIMNLKMTLLVGCMLAFFNCSDGNQPDKGLTYVLDMVHNNPGESATQTKYTNPEYVKEAGFNGIVPQWHVQCGLTYDSYQKGLVPEGSEEREWILTRQNEIKEKLKAAKKAGLKVYPFTDMFVMPTVILEKYKNQIVRPTDLASGFNAIHGKLVPDINQPLTKELIRAQVKELFETFPELDGLVIRFGETYLFDTPFHAGGNPVRSGGKDGIDGHVQLINLLKSEICEKYNKKLFYRTWDFGFFHTNADIYKKITDQVEPHPNLLFSIKYCQGDFHRLTRFNPTLGIGNHPYIIEYQGQPEYYGKGAHPVYVFGGMLNGFSEYAQNMKPNAVQSVAELKADPKFQGLWTWSRGGGWRGPYITNELWTDINTQAAATWARDTTLTEQETLNKTLLSLGVEKGSVNSFISLLHKSDEAVLKGQCTNIDVNKSSFNVWWTRDQYFSNGNSISGFINYIIKNGKESEMLEEKNHAVALWNEIESLASTIKMKDKKDEEYLRISATYGKIKHDLIRQIFTICLYGRKADLGEPLDQDKMSSAIQQYDALWIAWQNLKDKHPDCATLYEPNAFKLTDMSGVSGDPSIGIGATVDKYRSMIKK
jgi:hypothetical protein